MTVVRHGTEWWFKGEISAEGFLSLGGVVEVCFLSS